MYNIILYKIKKPLEDCQFISFLFCCHLVRYNILYLNRW